jgi:hypothetical protein
VVTSDPAPDDLPLDPALAAVLRSMRPDPRAVHAWAAPRIAPETVDAIAAADHGQDVREHRRALISLLSDADPPRRLEWVPHEVLVLVLGHGRDDGLGDLVDLYAGSLLLAARTPDRTPLHRLPPFLRAALALGPAERDAARAFLAWCRLTCPGDWPHNAGNLPFLTFGVLLLSVVAEPAPPDDVLRGLAAGLVEELDRSVVRGGWTGRLEPPLIGYGPRKPRRVWQEPARAVLIDGPLAGTEVGARLAVLGQVICRERMLAAADLCALFT